MVYGPPRPHSVRLALATHARRRGCWRRSRGRRWCTPGGALHGAVTAAPRPDSDIPLDTAARYSGPRSIATSPAHAAGGWTPVAGPTFLPMHRGAIRAARWRARAVVHLASQSLIPGPGRGLTWGGVVRLELLRENSVGARPRIVDGARHVIAGLRRRRVGRLWGRGVRGWRSMSSHISRGAAVFLNWRAVAILKPAACFSHIQGERIAAWLIAARRCIQIRSKVRSTCSGERARSLKQGH